MTESLAVLGTQLDAVRGPGGVRFPLPGPSRAAIEADIHRTLGAPGLNELAFWQAADRLLDRIAERVSCDLYIHATSIVADLAVEKFA